MPFTFAHPAAVMPLTSKYSKYFDTSALILGSMAPDFEYFIRFKAMSTIGHSLKGFISLNMILVFIIAIVWDKYIKRALILSLTPILSRYTYFMLYNNLRLSSLKDICRFIISALIGMISHVFWDAFTHRGAYFVSRISLLSTKINILGLDLPLYKILQHTSTIIGFLIIIIYIYLAHRRQVYSIPRINLSKKIMYWLSTMLITLIVFGFRILYTMESLSLAYFGIYIVSLISSGLIGIIITSFAYKILGVYDEIFKGDIIEKLEI